MGANEGQSYLSASAGSTGLTVGVLATIRCARACGSTREVADWDKAVAG